VSARKPTLADRYLADDALDAIYPLTTTDRLRAQVRQSQKFAFDWSASYRVGEIIRDDPMLVVREFLSLQPPYPLTWIEYRHDALWDAIHGKCDEDPEERDGMVAYLVDSNDVTVFIGGSAKYPLNGKVAMSGLAFEYNVHPDDPSSPTIRSANDPDYDLFDAYLWGSTLRHFDRDLRDWLRDRVRLHGLKFIPSYQEKNGITHIQAALKGSTGELRTILAFLAVMNRPTVTTFTDQPRQRGWIGNKPRSLAQHYSVRLSLDAHHTMRRVGTSEGHGVPHAAHPVSGHWRQNETARRAQAAGCMHDWQPTFGPGAHAWEPWIGPVQYGHRHWVCADCTGRKWRVDDYETGKKQPGDPVRDEYRVSK
jgi:hypothetical protein